MRIYIAGKYTDKNTAKIKQNIERAKNVAIEIQRLGHQPYCPHTHTGLFEKTNYTTYETMMKLHTTFLELWAEALIIISHSKGANQELKIAQQLGLPIYTNIEEIKQQNNNLKAQQRIRKKYLQNQNDTKPEDEKTLLEIQFGE